MTRRAAPDGGTGRRDRGPRRGRRSRVLFLGPGLYVSGYREIERLFRGHRRIEIEVSDDHRDIRTQHDLVVSLGYRRIIPADVLIMPAMGTIVLHSSDLPKGRGWAPLYHALAGKQRRHTVSMFYALEGVDDGPLIAKAHCPLYLTDTLASLRRKDDFLVTVLLKKYLPTLVRRRVPGCSQIGTPTFNRRRSPEDSRVPIDRPLRELFFALRALDNERYPGFFTVAGEKFHIRISPVGQRDRPVRYRIIDFSKPRRSGPRGVAGI